MTMTEQNARSLFDRDHDIYAQTGTIRFVKISESRCGIPDVVKKGDYILIVTNVEGGQLAVGIILFTDWGPYDWFVEKYGEERLSESQKKNKKKWGQIMVARETLDARIKFSHPIFFGGNDLQVGFRNSIVWGLSTKGQDLVEKALDVL